MTALRAFEAAARLGSFQGAADELSVTPGAIAQQIKKLEAWAGIRLFDRHAQGVSLTPAAARAVPDLTRALDTLGQAARILRQTSDIAEIRIAALPAVAQLWLSPRLSALKAALSGVDLSIYALDQCPSLDRGTYDLAIYPKTGGITLARNQLVPVAAPAVAATVTELGDLNSAALIHDVAWKNDWSDLAVANGIEGMNCRRGPAHSLYSIAVERCIAGDGILIGHTALIDKHLAETRLCRVLPDLAISGPDICLSVPEPPLPAILQRVIDAIRATA